MPKLPLVLVPAIILIGCVNSRHSCQVYVPIAHGPVAATSERPVTRVYAEPAAPPVVSSTPVTVPAPGAAPGDLAIAESISQLFVNDSAIEPWANRIQARVEGGVVTLRGVVASDH